MATTGRTGADAIFKDLRHICRMIVKFQLKLEGAVTLALAAEVLTAGQATTIAAFIASAAAACAAFEALAEFAGF